MAEDPDRPRPRRRWRLALFCLVIAAVVIAVVARRPRLEPGAVLLVHLEGDLTEGPAKGPLQLLGQAMSSVDGPLNLHDLRRALRRAARDPRIAGVMLEIHSLNIGWGAVEEIRGMVEELRTAKDHKPVQALLVGDFAQEKEYSVAAATDRIVASPESGLLLNGQAAEITFYRGTLDLLKVEPQFIQFKEYKSAAEPYINKQMSPAMREWVTSVLGEVHERFLAQVMTARKIAREPLVQLMDRGLQTAKEGLDAHLLDALGYRDEVEQALRGSAPTPRPADRLVTVGRYLGLSGRLSQEGQVALIYASGPIVSGRQGGLGGGAETIEGLGTAQAIREAVDSPQVKALVMRVNSPGGSAVGSDFVRREIARARERKKPVVVSMSTVAGSGGYWISMAADKIVAQPLTLTGSIGVVFGHFNVQPLLGWGGLGIDEVKFGKNANLMSPYHRLSDEQIDIVKGWMQLVYSDFVSGVAQGRGMTYNDVEPLAHGRVWTGAQARERHLVDELGGLEVALHLARERAGLPETDGEPVVYPKDQGLWAALRQLGGVAADLPAPAAALRALIDELGTPRPYVMAPTIQIH